MKAIRYPLLLAVLGAFWLGFHFSSEREFDHGQSSSKESFSKKEDTAKDDQKAHSTTSVDPHEDNARHSKTEPALATRPNAAEEPEWFSRVKDRKRIQPDPLLINQPGLEGLVSADLSEMEIRGQWMEKIYSLYGESMDKHQRRERGRLLELLEEATGSQTVARGEMRGLEIDGTSPTGQSFLLEGFKKGEPFYTYTVNHSAAESSAANLVRQDTDFDLVYGPDIDGSGFFFNVNDHGIARQHLEFQIPNGGGSRIIEREAPDADGHMDHVSGTVGAHGFREDAKGMSPAVKMYSLNQQSDADVDLLGMQYAFQSRRSIGGTTSLGSSHDSGDGGEYHSTARGFDESLLENPYYLHFYAAANNGGWDTVSVGRQMSKNLITVASGRHVNRDSSGNYISGGNKSGFSSRGPADDGRIKPDLTGNGEGVLSTTGTTGYGTKQGTSMATPNTSGSSILLQDYFAKRFPGHLMKSMTLKNLILHTADDLGDTGPDYTYGWGFMNTRKAADLIKAYADNPGNRRIQEAVMLNGETHTYTFTWDGSSPLIANITWLDYPGTSSFSHDDRNPDLVYDLDLRITSPSSSTTYLPWAMPFVLNGFNTDDWDTDAIKADNTTDNVEQVRIGSPTEAGIYTITVTHKGTISASHEVPYSLILSGVDDAASAPTPTISSFTPTEGTHDHLQVTVSGTGFLLGANVSLQAPGLDTVEGYGEMVSPTEIEVFFPLDRVPAGDYTLVVNNPDGQAVSSASDFVVTAYTDLLFEDFDAPGFTFAGAGWTTAADTGTNDWTLDSSVAISGNSAHVPTRTELVSSYLESPAIVVPDTNDPIKLSFQHQWDFEIELPTSSFGAHEGEDGALLMVSVNGGDFKHVDQSFWNNAQAQGTQIVSGDYWDNIDSTNPIRYPSATTYAWTDESGGWTRTTVLLDPAIYGDKTLRFRWWIGTQNTGIDNVEGWWIENVSLSIESDNVPPQVDTLASTQATEGQLYDETVTFSDANAGDTLSIIGTSLPAWLTFTDNGNGTASITGTPSSGNVGTHTVSIEASDGVDTRVIEWVVTVLPASGNDAPVFVTSTLDVSVIENAYTFDIVAGDANGHALSFSGEGLPIWLTLTDNGDGSATLSGTPNEYAVSTLNLMIKVTDGVDTTSQVFTLDVLPPATIEFSSSTATVDEGAGSVTLTVNRTLNSVGTVTVDYTTANGSANAGSDFTSASGTLTWLDGDLDPKTIEVQITDDIVYNESENFDVRISSPTGFAEIGSRDEVTVTITENDINLAPEIDLVSPASSLIALPTNSTLSIDTTVSDDGIINAFTTQWTVEEKPAGGDATFTAAMDADTDVVFTTAGLYVLRLTADDGGLQTSIDVRVQVGGSASITAGGGVNLERFNNISGSAVSNLTGNSKFQNNTPDVTSVLDTLFEASQNVANKYGQRVRGFYVAPQTGDYRFYIASNDSSELWLSPDNDPTNRVRIASVSGSTNSRQWTKYGSQESDEITLTAGGIYYIEALHKDNNGSDHLAVGVILPDASEDRPIAAANLALYSQNAIANQGPSVDAGGPYITMENAPFALSPTVSDDGLPTTPGTVSVEWSKVSGSGLVGFVDATVEEVSATFDTVGNYTLRLTATDGEIVTYDEVSVEVLPSGPAIFVSQTSNSTDVAEGSVTDTYSLFLGAEPAADVNIALTGDAQVSVDPANIVFTPSNWSTARIVTVTAVDDNVIEGPHGGIIGHAVTSTDGDYDGIAVSDVSVQIADNDSAGEIALTEGSISVSEGDGSLIFTVSRTGGSIGAVSVNYVTTAGSATEGADYTAASGTLNWGDGDTVDKTVEVTVLDDSDNEPNETFALNLSNVVDADLGAASSSTATIIDNDYSQYLINFGLNSYTTDGVNTWQSFNLTTQTAFDGTGDSAAITNSPLSDATGDSSAGLSFSNDISGSGTGNTALNAGLDASALAGDPYDWFDPASAEQREYIALRNGLEQSFTISGFAITDIVDFEFVFGRPKTGDRAVTVTHQTTGDIMNDQQVDEDGGPQYPSITSLTGATSYTFTFDMTGTGWGCLPNAMRIRVSDGGEFTPEMLSDLKLWLRDADTDFDGTIWSDQSGSGNDASPVGVLAEVTFGAPTAVTELPTSGAFDGKSIPALHFPASGDEMLRSAGLNGGSGVSETTIFTVIRTAGLDAASAEVRTAGFGSKAADETNNQNGNFQQASDGSLRYDNGNNLGPAIPTDLHIRIARLSNGSVKAWTHDQSGLDVTISETSTPSAGTVPDPTRVDDFYLGDLNGGGTTTSYLTSKNADIYLAEVIVYTAALSDEQVEAVSNYLVNSLGDVPQTAPDAPTGLIASTISSTEVNLSWTDNSGNETGFKVQRSATSGGPWIDLATTGVDVINYSDTALDPATVFYYQLIATNLGGDSAASNEANATTWTLQQQFFSDSGLPFDVAPNLDSDGDGANNEHEYIAGTNPSDRASVFSFEMSMPSAGVFRMDLPTLAGRYYRVLYRDSLVEGNWSPLSGYENIEGTGSTVQVNETTNGARFYRVEINLTPWN